MCREWGVGGSALLQRTEGPALWDPAALTLRSPSSLCSQDTGHQGCPLPDQTGLGPGRAGKAGVRS